MGCLKMKAFAKILETIDVNLTRVSRAILRERTRDPYERWGAGFSFFLFTERARR